MGRWDGKDSRIEGVCAFCNNSFLSYGTYARKFCSRRCYWDSLKGRPPVAVIVDDKEKERRKQRMMGNKNPMWKGGDSDKERRNRNYKSWRIKVFKRDEYICQDCGYYNGNGDKRRDLNAHHLVPWIDSLELRYVVDNGVTLCVPCHIKRHQNKSMI